MSFPHLISGECVEIPDLTTSSGSNVSTPNSEGGGRRKGDMILLAWNYARERGDVEVAAQLYLEYEKIVTDLPRTVSVDRRRKTEKIDTAMGGFWARFRRV
jgi:hypothetical protein